MSPQEAARILDLLAQGIDPESGELLPQDNVVHSPTVIRALFWPPVPFWHSRAPRFPKRKKTQA